MIGKCLFAITAISIAVAGVNGGIAGLSQAVLEGASTAVSLVISMCGMMCLWCGILEVLKKAGIISALSKILSPVLKFIFPDSVGTPAEDPMTAAICANILGIGNASTPLALRSMELLDRQNPTPERASRDMIAFTVLGTAPFALMPTTVVTLLSSLGASSAFRVIVPVWISSGITCAAAILLCRVLGRMHRRG